MALPLLPLSTQRRPPPVAPRARRLRRRQLLFWDKETQISREVFQKQLQPKVHCWECVSAVRALQGTEGVREGLGQVHAGTSTLGKHWGHSPKCMHWGTLPFHLVTLPSTLKKSCF